MKSLLFLPLLLLAGCCEDPKGIPTVCPDGSKCVVVDCTCANLTHSSCVVAFGQSCPNGYNILESKDGTYLIKCHDKW